MLAAAAGCRAVVRSKAFIVMIVNR